jgi:hypothetical protein
LTVPPLVLRPEDAARMIGVSLRSLQRLADCAVNVQPLPPAGPRHRKRRVFRRPAPPGRTACVGCTDAGFNRPGAHLPTSTGTRPPATLGCRCRGESGYPMWGSVGVVIWVWTSGIGLGMVRLGFAMTSSKPQSVGLSVLFLRFLCRSHLSQALLDHLTSTLIPLFLNSL